MEYIETGSREHIQCTLQHLNLILLETLAPLPHLRLLILIVVGLPLYSIQCLLEVKEAQIST